MSSTLWKKFNPSLYIKDNYSYIHDEDKQIIRLLLKFYKKLPQLNMALDIGTGPNLYPVMALLPFAKTIDCVDYSDANIEYLKKQLIKLDGNWYLFWESYKRLNPIYQNIDQVEFLKQKMKIYQGDIYSLDDGKYDLSSMFFCAESITNTYRQFALACKKFIHSVKPNGILVAAFMENSKKYILDNIKFPAYPVNEKILTGVFSPEVTGLKINHISITSQPLRPGYTGMLFLTAKRK